MLLKRRAFRRAAREEAARVAPEIEQANHRIEQLNAELDRELESLPGGRVKCPKCGDLMVVKIARRGANAGGKFWGCPDWPRCSASMNSSGIIR
jgi:restriction system protein